jgi:4-oxalomesaconate tautomerase
VAEIAARLPEGSRKPVPIEHPSGEFTVELELDPQDPQKVARAALLRTARLIMRGDAMVPAAAF